MTTTAIKPSTDTLMAAVARMTDRMGTSLHRAGLSVSDRTKADRHLRASERQRRAVHRLMDALAKAQNDSHSSWHFYYTIATIADHKRAITKEA